MKHRPYFFGFGLGRSALALAGVLRDRNWRIGGTCRSPEKAAALRALGYEISLFSRETPLAEVAAALEGATHILNSVPPDETGDPILDRLRDKIASLPSVDWIGYLSTTGVYGDRAGGWVDEESRPAPTGPRGRLRLAAEAAWLRLHPPAHIFRLAGIYGPGFSALDSLRRGRAQRIEKPGQVFSRIHVADIAAVLLASIAKPAPGRIYNLCDDDPAPPADVIAYAAELLGIAPPPLIPFAAATLSPMARSFYDDNKRVANRRIKEELGIRLIYPSYRDGLTAIREMEVATLSPDPLPLKGERED